MKTIILLFVFAIIFGCSNPVSETGNSADNCVNDCVNCRGDVISIEIRYNETETVIPATFNPAVIKINKETIDSVSVGNCMTVCACEGDSVFARFTVDIVYEGEERTGGHLQRMLVGSHDTTMTLPYTITVEPK